MNRIDYSVLAIPKGPTRYESKKAKKAEAEANWREVCRLVDSRDGRCCRVCGRPANTQALNLLERAERHHINDRRDTTDNLMTLCQPCHQGDGGRHGLKAGMRLSGDADQRDPVTGRLCGVRVERLTEAGWVVEKWV